MVLIEIDPESLKPELFVLPESKDENLFF